MLLQIRKRVPWMSGCVHAREDQGGQSQFGFAPEFRRSDVYLFSYGEGIIDFNAETPDGALDLRMSQQQLHGT
jgi:hypothetical protein